MGKLGNVVATHCTDDLATNKYQANQDKRQGNGSRAGIRETGQDDEGKHDTARPKQ